MAFTFDDKLPRKEYGYHGRVKMMRLAVSLLKEKDHTELLKVVRCQSLV